MINYKYFIIISFCLIFTSISYANENINIDENLAKLNNSNNYTIDVKNTRSADLGKYWLEISNKKNQAIKITLSNQNYHSVYKIPKKYLKNITSHTVTTTIENETYSLKLKNIESLLNESSRNQQFLNILNTNQISQDKFEDGKRAKVIITFNSIDSTNPSFFEKNGEVNFELDKNSFKAKKKKFQDTKRQLVKDLENYSIKDNSSGFSSYKNWIKRDFPLSNGVSSSLNSKEIAFLQTRKYVNSIEIDRDVTIQVQDSKEIINSDDVEYLTDNKNDKLTGKNIKVAVIDTGVDYTHSDFSNCSTSDFINQNCERFYLGYDFHNSDNDPKDNNGHGTHVAGIIGANSSTFKGIAPSVEIMPVKVLSSSGRGSLSTIIEGIEYAMDPNGDGNFSDSVDIISLSLGFYLSEKTLLIETINEAIDKGIIVVAAAGNEGPSESSIANPGIAEKVITVGASKKECDEGCDNSIASFSSRGPSGYEYIKPEIVAPGANICSTKYSGYIGSTTCIDESHMVLSGTSMATPMVSGVISQLKQDNPDITPKQMKRILIETANDLNESIFSQGFGEIDALNAYDQLNSGSQKISINQTYLFYNDENKDIFKENISITNSRDSRVNVSFRLKNFTKGNNTYDIGNISSSKFGLLSKETKNTLINVNTSGLNGVYRGSLEVLTSNSSQSIPIIIEKITTIEVLINNDINNLEIDIESVHIFDGNTSKSLKEKESSKREYKGRAEIGNYSILALGETKNEKILLAKDFLVSPNKPSSTTLNLSNTREYTIDGYSKKGNPLKFYEYNFGFFAYNNNSNTYLHSIINDYEKETGNKTVRVSNMVSNIENLDVIVKYEGVE